MRVIIYCLYCSESNSLQVFQNYLFIGNKGNILTIEKLHSSPKVLWPINVLLMGILLIMPTNIPLSLTESCTDTSVISFLLSFCYIGKWVLSCLPAMSPRLFFPLLITSAILHLSRDWVGVGLLQTHLWSDHPWDACSPNVLPCIQATYLPNTHMVLRCSLLPDENLINSTCYHQYIKHQMVHQCS